MPHLHIGVLDGAIVFAFVLIFGYMWRITAAHFSERPIGKAMAVLY